MSITNKIEYYKESLETFDDTLEKYRFLLDQGKKALPFLKNSDKTHSKYLDVKLKYGLFHI